MMKAVITLITTAVLLTTILPVPAYAAIKGVKPSEACDLFTNSGLSTSGWHIYYDYVCGCSSEHSHSLPSVSLEGKLSYFVEGTCRYIRRIKLVVEIEDSVHEEKLIAQFKNAVKIMIEKITRQPAPPQIFTAIDEKKSTVLLIGETYVTVGRITWTRVIREKTREGYDLFVILE